MSTSQNSVWTLPRPPNYPPLEPQKVKNYPKLSQNQILEFKETEKMKVVQLYEYTLKQLSKPTPTPKKPIRTQKSQQWPQN